MMRPSMAYPFQKIEAEWQKRWHDKDLFRVGNQSDKPKYYVLDMFPYPSAHGLHVGHAESYTATDIVARYRRAAGYHVLHPTGFDAYGLPAEQYAISTGIHPEETTRKAMDNYRRQLMALGYSYDWSREVATCDAKYYRWTQHMFLKLLERGLAYQKEVAVNWCPALRTVLANEEVVDGKSERGGHPVERRPMLQWMLKITDYAEQLLEDLDDPNLDWPERTKEAQRNWIGRSIGLNIDFTIEGSGQNFTVFTTRADTIYGVTFMVLAPEHPLVEKISGDEQRFQVTEYQAKAASKSDLDRQAAVEKTGVFTGAYAVNPANSEKIPIWISDYVLMDYGCGAVMAVPGHDERDFEFAKKFDLPIVQVIAAKGSNDTELPYSGDGVNMNSGPLDGLAMQEATEKIHNILSEKGVVQKQVHYRLRDWLFSRQRYWGEPFPVVHYPKAGLKAVPENELPVLLPPVDSYQPREDGSPPLQGAAKDWLEYKDKTSGEVGRRETDTMPGSAGSSWYFLRYCDPGNEKEFCSFKAQKYWMPVDLYIGGAEHTVGHLLYARFWQKVLFDAGLVSHKEPFKKLVHQGMILGEDNEKMSKSHGNVVNPDDVVAQYGADSLRLYVMFMGPIERDKPWSSQGINGVHKFLNRLWSLVTQDQEQPKIDLTDAALDDDTKRLLHQTIKKVSHDCETLAFNTAISQMMILLNDLVKKQCRSHEAILPFLQCLAPFAPHIAEDLWHRVGQKGFIIDAAWPTYDEQLAKADQITMAVQINGKTKGKVEVVADAEQEEVESLAKELAAINTALSSGDVKKVIFVKNRIINFIVVG